MTVQDQTGMYDNGIIKPRLLRFPGIGKSALGYISVAEGESLPFEVKRVYWTYYTPEDVIRGGHAHHQLEQVLIAVSGKITVNVELANNEKHEYVLDNPGVGLYIPRSVWRTLQYTHNAVQVCIASMEYEENDYIRDYESFKKMSG
jgi:dTDP-4-dehydrorhamnose 3,5-epimerase-like enzyme